MRFYNYPFIGRLVFRDALFSMQKNVYLTIDDCENLGITCLISDLLAELSVKAVFFCCGKFLTKKMIDCLKKNGHSIGNHTFSHSNGFYLQAESYIKDVIEFDKIYKTRLFRPPFGKLTFRQYKKLLQLNKQIIFWNLMTYDFDLRFSQDFILNNAIKRTKNGTIIVFHSNNKTEKFIATLLEKYVKQIKNKGLIFDLLSE